MTSANLIKTIEITEVNSQPILAQQKDFQGTIVPGTSTVSIKSGVAPIKPPIQYPVLLSWISTYNSPHGPLPMILSNFYGKHLVFLVLIAFCNLTACTLGSPYFLQLSLFCICWLPGDQDSVNLLRPFPHLFEDSKVLIGLISPSMETPQLHWLPLLSLWVCLKPQRGRVFHSQELPRLPSAPAPCAWGRVARIGNKVLEIPMDVAGIRSQDNSSPPYSHSHSLPPNKSTSGHKWLTKPIRKQHFRPML